MRREQMIFYFENHLFGNAIRRCLFDENEHCYRKLVQKPPPVCQAADPTNRRRLFTSFFHSCKPGAMVVFLFDPFIPHGSRPHPKAIFAVQRPIDNHRLQCLRMGGDSDDLVEVAFEMTVFSRFDIHKKLLPFNSHAYPFAPPMMKAVWHGSFYASALIKLFPVNA